MQEDTAGSESDRNWRRIEALLDAALDRPPAERSAFLEAACDDGALRAEVERLLEKCEADETFLDQPVAPFAADLLAKLARGEKERPAVPPRIGAFRIIREIGHGGMGTVYVAERESHFEQRVALKVVRRGLELDDEHVRRFVDERQILASLEHANIARLLDGGVTDQGAPWFAMELVEGEPIDQYCDARRLPIEIRLELFCAACDAADYAHHKGVVHRDLKPSNVLVRADGAVKLLDFGIAKLVAGDGETRTRTSIRLLTPAYASPEQLRGEAVAPASDVYSLGVLLFELLTGQRPPPADVVGASRDTGPAPAGQTLRRPSAVLSRSRSTQDGAPSTATLAARARATTPERLAERLRGELDRITLRALAGRPADRYPSAAALADDVRRHLEGLPVRARPWARVLPSRIIAAAGAAAAMALVVLGVLSWSGRTPPAVASVEPGTTLAVGLIADYRNDRSQPIAAALADLLATNLARVPSLAVVSTARLYELMASVDAGADAGAFSSAARRAGAGVLIDGALYGSGSAGLRLDLRRIDVRTGAILSAYTVSGDDLFALVDSGTARIAAEAGSNRPTGSIADVTTRSVVAYRFYEEGIRSYYRGDLASARRMLEAAVREDSALAMAVYYLARLETRREHRFALLERAVRLADGASDRERLIIRAAAAFAMADPAAVAIAETLSVRYPLEPEGHRFAGQARLEAGDFMGALSSLQHAVTLDSLALAGTAAPCTACDARSLIVGTYVLMDSLPAARRQATRWTELEPESALSWIALSEVLINLGEPDTARAAYQRATRIDPTLSRLPYYFAYHVMDRGDYEAADRAFREILDTGSEDVRPDALWYLTISLRRQGRHEEALRAARDYRALVDAREPEATSLYHALPEAQVLLEMGRWAESTALFDSIAHVGPPATLTSLRPWALTLGANGLAEAGDTAALAARLDTVRALGASSLMGRDKRLYQHVDGLLLAARGDDEAAAAAFRQAMLSTAVYTRTNLELARALIRLGRAPDAVTVLRPTILGSMEASALYATRTDLQETLGRAWDAAGVADSAVVHYRSTLHALRGADPRLGPRVASLRDRVAQLAKTLP